jgi:hypothetical protein
MDFIFPIGGSTYYILTILWASFFLYVFKLSHFVHLVEHGKLKLCVIYLNPFFIS